MRLHACIPIAPVSPWVVPSSETISSSELAMNRLETSQSIHSQLYSDEEIFYRSYLMWNQLSYDLRSILNRVSLYIQK